MSVLNLMMFLRVLFDKKYQLIQHTSYQMFSVEHVLFSFVYIIVLFCHYLSIIF